MEQNWYNYKLLFISLLVRVTIDKVYHPTEIIYWIAIIVNPSSLYNFTYCYSNSDRSIHRFFKMLIFHVILKKYIRVIVTKRNDFSNKNDF